MASSVVDSDNDDDLLQPSIPSKTWIITPDMVDEVLAVCLHASQEAIKQDLYQTGSVASTINRILDGEIASENKTAVSNHPKRDKLPGVINNTISSSEEKNMMNPLSDTEVDTDTDDSDIVIMDEKREKIFTSLKERLGKSIYKNPVVLKKTDWNSDDSPKEVPNNMKMTLSMSEKLPQTSEIQDSSFTNEPCEEVEVDHVEDDDNDVVLLYSERRDLSKKQASNGSEIIDLSFDDENDANDLARNLKEKMKSVSSNHQLNTLVNDTFVKKQELKSRKNSSNQKTEMSFCLRIEIDDEDDDTCEARVTDVSASESETEDLPSIFPSMGIASSTSSSQNEMEFSQEESLDDESIPRKKKKYSAEETRTRKEEKKLSKEMEKQKKKEMAESKKLEKQKAQLVKKKQKEADTLNQKAQKKEECLKVMEVCMDREVLTKGAADGDVDPILAKCASMGVSYSFRSHPIPKSITWKRAAIEHKVGEDLEITASKTYSDESRVIVRLDIEAFITLADEFKTARCESSARQVSSIDSFFSNLTTTYTNKTVTVVILGLEKYFRDMKTRQARQFRNAVRGDTAGTTSRSRKTKKTQNTSAIMDKLEIEELLVYLELTTDIKITLCETEKDFAEFVGMFTKALAEAPFKKSQPETFSFCVDFGKKPPVKVGKDGSGLLKLWQQQLQQYHNVSANMAAAIVSVYPSPQLLVQAYRQCSDEKTASLLLKDIVVRRGEGVLSTSRRIGPELSRQIYILFNSSDGQTLTK